MNSGVRTALGTVALLNAIEASVQLRTQVQQAANGSGVNSDVIDGYSTLLGTLRGICNYLPVLGSYYGSMLDGAPQLIAVFNNALSINQERVAQLDRGRIPGGLQSRGERSGIQISVSSNCLYCALSSISSCSERR
jgi:hypothetical protein